MLTDWASLSLEHQVAQLVVVRASGFLFDHQIQYPQWEPSAATLKRWVSELGVGGVILLGGSAVEVGLRSQQVQDWAAIPLLIAADIEEGVGQRFPGATWFPPPMALGAIAQQNLELAIALAEAMGDTIAQEALAIGINWLLAPVVDVNNNPQNPVINVRSFGETPDRVSKLTTAFIRGAQHHPILTVAKHFPGHGDTDTDSHLYLPVLPHSRDRLEQVEFPPFKGAIAAGVDAVMTAHVQVPALDPESPATLSHTLLTNQLRTVMGFDGLIVTDALVMGAIAERYGIEEVAVLALEAGADILLMPAHPDRTIAAVCAAVEAGRISLERIHASLDRLWRAKAKAAITQPSGDTSHTWEQLSPPAVHLEAIAQPEAQNLSAEMLHHAMQSHIPTLVPIAEPTESAWNLILVDTAIHCPMLGLAAPAIARPLQRGYQLKLLDGHAIADEPPQNLPPTVLQLFIRANPFRSTAGIIHQAQVWLKALTSAKTLRGVALYGSPYVLEILRPLVPDEIPWVFSYGQMPQAQAIALEALFGGDVGKWKSDRTFTD
jgi:beta-glucosidase